MYRQFKKRVKKKDYIDYLLVMSSLKKLNKRKKITSVEDYEKAKYAEYYKREANLEDPKNYSEFLLWQKIKFFDDRATIMTDKVKSKEYITSLIGDKITYPQTLKIYKNANDIDLSVLPDNVIIKCNHNSGYIFHVRKLKNGRYAIKNLRKPFVTNYRVGTMRKILNLLLKSEYFYQSFEWNYKNIKPLIFAEEYLDFADSNEYKLYMNDGKLICFHVVSNRQTDERNDFFDDNLQPMNVWADVPPSAEIPVLPKNIYEMIDIAKILSKGFAALRVDLYTAINRIYFGEATFFHMGGYIKYRYPLDFDEIIGSKMKLPENIT